MSTGNGSQRHGSTTKAVASWCQCMSHLSERKEATFPTETGTERSLHDFPFRNICELPCPHFSLFYLARSQRKHRSITLHECARSAHCNSCTVATFLNDDSGPGACTSSFSGDSCLLPGESCPAGWRRLCLLSYQRLHRGTVVLMPMQYFSCATPRCRYVVRLPPDEKQTICTGVILIHQHCQSY